MSALRITSTPAVESTASSLDRPTFRAAILELVFVVCVGAVYFLTRGLARGTRSLTLDNARHLLAIEQLAHLDFERSLQRALLGHDWLVQLANTFYVVAHLPVLAGIAVWLFWRQPRRYRFYRRAFLLSAALGLVVYILLPLAPPRFLPGFVDTERLTGFDVDSSALGLFYNPFAAMPSLHVGWSLLAAVAVIACAHAPWLRVAAAGLPALMTFAVILTGNHFILDAVAGVLVVLCALVGAGLRPSLHLPTGRNKSDDTWGLG